MIQYRPFGNNDPPGIAAVWNSQPPLRGRIAPLSCAMLEQHVLSKPFFDPRGLIVAAEGDRILGFVHAGFAPGERAGELEYGTGVICQLLVALPTEHSGMASELLTRGEEYLRNCGTREQLGGAVGWRGPFYFGLYGGSQLPGVLDSDSLMASPFREAGYAAHRRRVILQRNLADFRPCIDRESMQLRRRFRLEQVPEQELTGWDETCAWCWIERDQFAVVPVAGGRAIGSLTFWNMENVGGSCRWCQGAVGLLEAHFEKDPAEQELSLCFLGEAMRHYQSQGVTSMEIQMEESDVRLGDVCRRLGFQEIELGTQFRKSRSTA